MQREGDPDWWEDAAADEAVRRYVESSGVIVAETGVSLSRALIEPIEYAFRDVARLSTATHQRSSDLTAGAGLCALAGLLLWNGGAYPAWLLFCVIAALFGMLMIEQRASAGALDSAIGAFEARLTGAGARISWRNKVPTVNWPTAKLVEAILASPFPQEEVPREK